MYNHTPVSVTVRAELRQWGEPLRVLSPATEEFVSSVGNVGTYYKGKTEGQGKGDKEVPWYREAADGVIRHLARDMPTVEMCAIPKIARCS